VPRVATTLTRKDFLGTLGARTGFGRATYRISPGLYCTGTPSSESPVLVTANYKLSFDALRKELPGIDAWILVVDTRGINVWCAAGKGTFSAEEVDYQVVNTGLDKVVNHRKIILPQLSANGVNLREIKTRCGFRAVFGPIKSSMLPEYLTTGESTELMRTVTFTLAERAVLIPLEICMLWKQILLFFLFFGLLSGFSKEIFSLSQSYHRTGELAVGLAASILSGAVLTPLLLPWIPFKQFWLKGAILGVFSGCAVLGILSPDLIFYEALAMLLLVTGASSYLAMNFTGSTVFTSLSGVGKEMRKGLAFQICATVSGVFVWFICGFLQ
jgi:hypothetical protein